MALKDSTLKMLIEKAKEHKVKKLMLFGSCLSKSDDEAGDIDLAAEMLPGGNIYQFHGDLLCSVKTKDVDMVNLKYDTRMIPYVMEEGVVIYES